MKHFVTIVCLALCCIACTVQAQEIPIEKKSLSAGEKIADKMILYIPNRFIELFDIFSLELETGATLKAGIRLTDAFGFGFGFGPSGVASKDFNRQYGFSLNDGWQWNCFVLNRGDVERIAMAGNLKPYWFQYHRGLFPDDSIFKQEIKDFWAFDVRFAALVGVRFAFHPRQFADFITGIFGYDFLDNDLHTGLF